MFVSELEFELHKRQLNRILEIERLKLKDTRERNKNK